MSNRFSRDVEDRISRIASYFGRDANELRKELEEEFGDSHEAEREIIETDTWIQSWVSSVSLAQQQRGDILPSVAKKSSVLTWIKLEDKENYRLTAKIDWIRRIP